MTREEFALAVLAAGEGKPHSPVQIQKLLFILDQEISDQLEGPHFNFEPYDYGPFDRNVYEVMDQLRDRGLVEECHSPGRTWKEYRATLEGQERGTSTLEALPEPVSGYIRELSSWARGLSFRSLVASVYKAYPAMQVNSVFQ